MSFFPRSSIKAPGAHATLSAEMQIRWDLVVAAVALVVVMLDQFTKQLVVSHFSGTHAFDVVPVFGNVVTLEYLQNPGAAFSSFTKSPGVLAFLIAVAVGVIAWLYWTTRSRANPWLKVTFGLIFGGAIGNLIDRIRIGHVVDFIHFQLPSLHFDFAVFNVADAGISVGVVLLAIIFWTLPRDNESTNDIPLAPQNPTQATEKPAMHHDEQSTGKGKPLGSVPSPQNSPRQSTSGTFQSKTPTSPLKANATANTSTVTPAKPVSVGASKVPPRNAAMASGRPTVKSKKKRH